MLGESDTPPLLVRICASLTEWVREHLPAVETTDPVPKLSIIPIPDSRQCDFCGTWFKDECDCKERGVEHFAKVAARWERAQRLDQTSRPDQMDELEELAELLHIPTPPNTGFWWTRTVQGFSVLHREGRPVPKFDGYGIGTSQSNKAIFSIPWDNDDARTALRFALEQIRNERS